MTIKQQTTFCRICEAQCGLITEVDIASNQILSIKPDEDHVVSKGYACIKGLTFEDFRTSPDRLTTPLKRISKKDEPAEFEAISWQQAFSEIGTKVKQLRKDHGDESTGLYFGNPIAFSLLYPIMINGFINGLNSSKFFNTGTLDCNNKFVVADKMYGSGFALTYPNVDKNQFLMIIGGNPAISKMSFIHLPHPMKRIGAIIERGGRVIHVNPRKTESAQQAGEHAFIRPDTDVFMLLSFLHEVFEQDATHTNKEVIRKARIAEFMAGDLAQLQTLAAQWPAEKTAAITGISTETLRDWVTSYLAADGAALYLSTGVNQGSNGVLAFWIQEVINAITGNLDNVNGVQMGQGILDYAGMLAKNPPATKVSRINGVESFMDAFPAAIIADEILTPGDGQMKGFFSISGNPVLSATKSKRFAEALKQLELLVCVEIVQNETANYADYILPGTHFAERADVPFLFASLCGTMPVPYYQYSDALVSPPGDCKDEMWILHQLAKACQAPLFGSKLFQGMVTLGEHLRKQPIFNTLTLPLPLMLLTLVSRFGKQGSIKSLRQYPHGKLLAPLQANNYLGKRVCTASQRVELTPQALIDLAQQRLSTSFTKHQQEQGQLRLITKRERFSHNTWTHNHAKYIKGKRHSNYLYINPQDAAAIAAADGDQVSVSSKAGSVTVPLCLDDNMMPGSVALPHGWGHAEADGQRIAKTTSGVNVNILADDGPDSIEPLSGMTQFNGIAVTVEKIAAG